MDGRRRRPSRTPQAIRSTSTEAATTNKGTKQKNTPKIVGPGHGPGMDTGITIKMPDTRNEQGTKTAQIKSVLAIISKVGGLKFLH